MYESPITIVYGDIETEFKEKTESLIVRCVQNVGVDVNKDELIKALSYDRGQYDKGYADAKAEIIRCKDCKHWIPYDWMFSEVWQSRNINDYPEDEIGCNYCDMAMKANDFCSRGERITDG